MRVTPRTNYFTIEDDCQSLNFVAESLLGFMALFSLKLDNYIYSSHGASFLKRGWVCPLSYILAFEEYCFLGCDVVKSDKSRGSAFLRNVDKLVRGYTPFYPSTLQS
jgi:hypothetical protein